MPILSFKSILFFRGNHRQYLKRESPCLSECLVFYTGVLNRRTFSIHQSIDVRLIIPLRHEFRHQEKYFRQNLNGTVTLKKAYPLPTRPKSRIFEKFFPMSRKPPLKVKKNHICVLRRFIERLRNITLGEHSTAHYEPTNRQIRNF